MTRSDICIIAIIYITCLIFTYMTLQFKPAAQIYPLCLIGGLAVLNTLYLGRCLIRMFKEKGHAAVKNDVSDAFKGFMGGQFFFVVGACIVYMILIHYIGFYPSGLIYLIAVMWWLDVKPLPMFLTIVLLGCLVYAVFTLFLKVPLPVGTIFA